MEISNLYRIYNTGIFWQRSVIDKDINDPSALTPDVGDRYIVGPAPSGAWEGHSDEVAQYRDDLQWDFISPQQGHALWVENENHVYIYSYDEWVKIGSTWYNDESAQDAVGRILDDGSSGNVSFVYYDETPPLILANVHENNLDHNSLNNYIESEHLDWSQDQSGYNISSNNITELSITQYEESINHNVLSNYITNEHINHSNINLSTSYPLTGSGNLTENINFGILLDSSDLKIDESNQLYIVDEGIDHDQTTNYVINEHIDHTSISISPSGILNGGGSIDENVTLGLDHSNVDHDQTTNFLLNEHIDHSTVSISAGTGLSGGGDLTSTRTIDIDVDSLTAVTNTEGSLDYLVIYDDSETGHSKITPGDLVGSIANYASISDNGSIIVNNASDLNFDTNINVADDGDDTVTISVPNDLTVMSNYSTSDLSEGDNLYYTDSRVATKVDSYLSGGTGISYSSGTISNTDTGSDAVSSHESSYNHSNYNTAYDRSVTGVSGSGNGTLTINRQNVSDVTADLSHTHDSRYYTESESDGRFVKEAGDTMTGDLNMGNNATTYTNFEIRYNSSSNSLDFNFIG